MTRFRHLLLLVLILALPLQGAMAATRLSAPAPRALPESASAPTMHVVTPSHATGAPCHQHTPPSPDAAAHGDVAAADAASASAAAPGLPDQSAPSHDHGGGTCKLCAACCLTAAVPPALPLFVPVPTGFAGYQSIVVPVPHNVADGLERPPRTI